MVALGSDPHGILEGGCTDLGIALKTLSQERPSSDCAAPAKTLHDNHDNHDDDDDDDDDDNDGGSQTRLPSARLLG